MKRSASSRAITALVALFLAASITRAAVPGTVNSSEGMDGTQLAFASSRAGNLEIYRVNGDGTDQTRLTTNAALNGEPAWSPDGTQLAFSSTRSGNRDIYRMNADGSGLTRLTTSSGVDLSPATNRPRTPDVTVTKSSNVAIATIGDTVTYNVRVGNAGSATAHHVTLSDSLPADIDWSINNAAEFELSNGSLTLRGQPTDLPAGASRSVEVTGIVTAQTCASTLTNVASMAATNEPRANRGNNTSVASIAIRCANLQLAKIADASPVTAGEDIGFLLTVTNAGPGMATGVVLSDDLPANAGLDWTIDVTGSDAGCAIFAGALTCSFGSLPAGGGAHAHVTSPTTSSSCGAVSNSATAVADNAISSASSLATLTVDCPLPGISIANATVGKDLQQVLSGALGAPAPLGGVEVTITSLDPNVLLATSATAVGGSTITLSVAAATSNLPAFYVQALADSGTVEIVASAPGYAPDTSTITLAPSGFVISSPGNFTTTTLSPSTAIQVTSGRLNPIFLTFAGGQPIRAGLLSVNVAVTSSDPTVGTITVSPLTFSGNETTKSTALDPLGLGITVIGLEAPAGFTTPSNLQQITATVTE